MTQEEITINTLAYYEIMCAFRDRLYRTALTDESQHEKTIEFFLKECFTGDQIAVITRYEQVKDAYREREGVEK